MSNELRHIKESDVQAECAKLVQPEAVYIDRPNADGTCFGSIHLVGLCAKCRMPIGYHFTNGGKLRSARTLRLEHVLTGNIKCEK